MLRTSIEREECIGGIVEGLLLRVSTIGCMGFDL